jgi:probable rRNA maturation factor
MQINFEIKNQKWLDYDNKIQPKLNDLVHKIISYSFLQKKIDIKFEIELGIQLIGDEEMQKINHQYRHKNQTTNVLSFPAFDFLSKTDINISNQTKLISLGDIFLSYEKIQHESQEQDKKFNDHLTHLLIHGILHLLGYDHENNNDAYKMETLEISILKNLDINNPYIIYS